MSGRKSVQVAMGAMVLAIPLALAGTANASGGPHGAAFALQARGAVNYGPISAVDSASGPAKKSMQEYRAPDGSLVAGVLNAEAGPGWAKSSLADLRLKLQAYGGGSGNSELEASVLSSSCSGGSGEAHLADFKWGDKREGYAPPPNTGISIPGYVSVLLNKQTRNADGSLTVVALSVKVDGHQSLDIASSTCSCPEPTATPTPSPTSPSSPPATSPPTSSAPSPSSPNESPAGPLPEAPTPVPVAGHLPVTG
ncbi:choice-of-anchor P family protein [Amycolatopsis sp. H20-H5]|uniref:choice-of-anchor P family protein n=1 Tax=Amycolatopsis sp. H20-H5 TaxID=3046309 RepID=UPI002DB72E80|nr:choice-of-anchor P family protein [Amycolatopsis sp. H20-H5]MEC3976582.1 choice-of-anchor P family protein [Amycolatopsis sp. H20-H5]